ncbi:DedA family membrane protein, type I (SNARE domain) [Aliarcobacter faecis]|uniref:DedA family protein n=1 Tax=Aliarcobacter faecis TaxID=1564138 RepID=UPI0004795621|nr:DedA family protein [Aliarcobacter faecis]QKF73705.1 DedA family membrane protein, type I (SNARE domain) [Aliarcobacter faecis]
MRELFRKIQPYTGKIFAIFLVLFISFLAYSLYQAPVIGIDEKFAYLLRQYGYIILFVWGMLEGEAGLIMAGLLAHTGDMNLYLAIFVAGLGGFAGDQVYFYIGRFNKDSVLKRLRGQRRKFAFAHLLLKKHGWPIIFTQRYMYGMRTIIPISIGITRYDARKFAVINLISAWCWAAITIVPVWYFGEQIMIVLHWAKAHWYLAIPLVIIFGGGIIYYFNKATKKIEKRMMNEN